MNGAIANCAITIFKSKLNGVLMQVNISKLDKQEADLKL